MRLLIVLIAALSLPAYAAQSSSPSTPSQMGAPPPTPAAAQQSPAAGPGTPGAASAAVPGAPAAAPAGANSGGALAAPAMLELDSNRDGFVSNEEARRSVDVTRRFYEIDRNRDGRIDGYEFNAGVPPKGGPDKRLQ